MNDTSPSRNGDEEPRTVQEALEAIERHLQYAIERPESWESARLNVGTMINVLADVQAAKKLPVSESEEVTKLRADLAAAQMDAKALKGFADLWYFAMDDAPGDFERIVTTCTPKSWMHEIAKIKRGERA